MTFLEKFSQFDTICIQCHDSPDADALGSGYGLYAYFRALGKSVNLVYTGTNWITKPALCKMVDELEIPIQWVEELPVCDILITVDCQYEGGNITVFDAPQVAMVDHHPCCVPTDEWCCIHSDYGSCCTVVWELLEEVNFAVNRHPKVATALYYGLYRDTRQLSEIYHVKDRQMRDSLGVNREWLEEMVNSNLSREELKIAGEALAEYYYDENRRFAILETRPCDPNLLGVISDLASQVATIDVCVVYSETTIGYKMSLRSTVKKISASDMSEYISDGVGSGGGHFNKAGGFIVKRLFEKKYSDRIFSDVLKERICLFFQQMHGSARMEK